MDNKSTRTITDIPTPPRSYSQALMRTQELRRTPHPDLTRLIDDWIQQTRQALSALKNQPFDKQLWNN